MMQPEMEGGGPRTGTASHQNRDPHPHDRAAGVDSNGNGDGGQRESWAKLQSQLIPYGPGRTDPEPTREPDNEDLDTGAQDRSAEAILAAFRANRPREPEVLDDGAEPEPREKDPEPEPPPYGSIDGAAILDEIRQFLRCFVVYPTAHAHVAHTLWIGHCWLMDRWDPTPRIAFLSPEPGSGKSRALEVTESMVPRPVMSVNTTSAYLFRKVSDREGPPTILYDEIDTVFGAKAKEHEDVRGLINAGHRKGATAGRCVVRGKVVKTEELPAYCAVALAGLDDLPDTIMSRCVVIRMQPRAPTEMVAPWRRRINFPEGERIAARLSDWARSCSAVSADIWPQMAAGVEDRAADVWEALLAVADLAGGHWTETARVAAVADVAASVEGHPHSLGVQLLADVREAFSSHGADRLATDLLLTYLRGKQEAPWATIRRGESIDARGLAQRLKKYGVCSADLRFGEIVLKGYTRGQFEDAWSRYLDAEIVSGSVSAESATSATSATPEESMPPTGGQP
jgi:hypothetical protein